MKIKITGAITPPRGTPGANSAYLVDLEMEIPEALPFILHIHPTDPCHFCGSEYHDHGKCTEGR